MREPLAWVAEGDRTDTILAIGKDAIFTAIAGKGDLFNAQDMVRTGSDPKRVLPREYSEYPRETLLEVRHQRGLPSIRILYRDGKKQRKMHHVFDNSKSAAEAAQAIAKAMKLSTEPREETATIAEITWGPLVAVAVPLAVWGAILRPIRRILGPSPAFLIIAVLLLSALGYWCYLFVNRPVVDVYAAIVP
jgi:hypothetical protein